METTRSDILQEIANGNLNPKMLTQFFNDMKIKSFAYDYLIQRDLVHLRSMNFTLDPAKVKTLYGIFDTAVRGLEIECNFEVVCVGSKAAYKQSSVYGKPMDYAMVDANMKYFRNNPIVFVNGEIFTKYRLIIKQDKVKFYFTCADLHDIAVRQGLDEKVDTIVTDVKVIFVPNAVIDIADDLIPGMIAGNNIDARNFASRNFIYFNGISNCFGFWINKETGDHFMIPYLYWNAESQYFTIDGIIPSDVTQYKLMVIGTNIYKQYVDVAPETEYYNELGDLVYPDGDTYLQFTSDQMPIPKDDLIILIKRDDLDVYTPNDGSVSIEEYYPNIYKIINKSKKHIRILVLSDERAHNDHIVYDNEIAPYMKRVNLLSAYKNDSVPAIIKSFNPVEWLYSIYDFLKSTDQLEFPEMNRVNVTVEDEEGNTRDLILKYIEMLDVDPNPDEIEDDMYALRLRTEKTPDDYDPATDAEMMAIHKIFNLEEKGGWDPFLYKMDTISGMLKKWFYFYEEYVRRTYGFLGGWYHNIAKYTNMDSKIRNDTSQETSTLSLQHTFTEPHYVFRYKNNCVWGLAKSYIFYIDGKYTIPTKIIVDHGYQYVYFPVSKIKKDSIIEVERFDGLVMNLAFTLPEEGLKIKFGDIAKINTIANCLFLVDNDDKTYVPSDAVDVYVTDPELGRFKLDLATSVFAITTDMTLELIPAKPEYVGKTIRLCANNKTFQFFCREDGFDFGRRYADDVDLNYRGYITSVNKSVMPRLRIYTEDGRLIPKRAYTVYNHTKFTDKPKFYIALTPDKSVNFMIAYTGYDERLIYHRDTVPSNGLVCFEGRTTRPFSLKYHDIYLNGYRLTKYDIEVISPYTIVLTCLEKYDTTSTLEIYEKKHVNDRFVKFEYEEQSEYIMDKLMRVENSFRSMIERNLPKYTPTGRVSNVDEIDSVWFEFWHYYIPFHYINGDVRRDLEVYHHAFMPGDRILLNADDRVRMLGTIEAIYYLSHDLTIEQGGPPEAPHREMDENMLEVDESIEVDEETYKHEGYKVNGYNPVYEDPFKPVEPDLEPTEEEPGASATDERYVPGSSFPHMPFYDHYITNNS